MKVEIDVDDDFINDLAPGHKLVRLGKPKIGELFLSHKGVMEVDEDAFLGLKHCLILKKIKPKRRVFELVRENSRANEGEYYEHDKNMNYSVSTTTYFYDVYKEIKENE